MKRVIVALVVLAAAVAGWRWSESRSLPAILPPLPARGQGPLSVAATGDTLLVRPFTASDARTVSPLVSLLGGADFSFTNLETSLLLREHVPETIAGRPQRPYGTAEAADVLRRLGINVASLANNHASDYDVTGLVDTQRILESVGVRHGGTGENVEAARAPVIVGSAPRRIAMVGVSTSASAESRATTSWAGINALRFTVNVTADPATFDTLKQSGIADISGRDTLTLHGTPITRGPRTVVELVGDADDERQILDQIARARALADVVIVSLHAHEPRNDNDEPAAFVRRFARSAIDAGAALVVGHGPHRVRGIEAYGRGAILYSVGNFIFQDEGLDPRAMDAYDSGVDLFGMATRALDADAPTKPPTFDEPIWWEAVIARATFDAGGLVSLQLIPIDLGAGLPKGQRGLPRLASGDRAERIVNRLAQLSRAFDTRVVAAQGSVTVELQRTAGER